MATAINKKVIVVTGNNRHREHLSNARRHKLAQKTSIVGCRYLCQSPNAWMGEVTRAFFNISRLNKPRQYF